MSKKPFGDWLSEYRGDDLPIHDLKEHYIISMRLCPWSDPVLTPSDLFCQLFLLTYTTQSLEALRRASELYGEPFFSSEFSISQEA